jgi:hypothetical protein
LWNSTSGKFGLDLENPTEKSPFDPLDVRRGKVFHYQQKAEVFSVQKKRKKFKITDGFV